MRLQQTATLINVVVNVLIETITIKKSIFRNVLLEKVAYYVSLT